MSKATEIATLIMEGKSTTTIVDQTGASKSYIYAIKADLKRRQDEDPEPTVLGEEDDLTEFVKDIKIIPDKKVLTTSKDSEKEAKTEQYICGSCGATWEADAKEFQRECPECGQEF